MKTTKKLICLLAAGTALAAAAPAFADPGWGRERDYQSAHRYYDNHDRYADRGAHRGWNRHRGWDRRRVVVVRRPVIVERPAYYVRPAPRHDIDVAPALIIGAVIGGYLFSQR